MNKNNEEFFQFEITEFIKLWKVLSENKWTIIFLVSIISTAAGIFIFSKKKPTPLYLGSTELEIGRIIHKDTYKKMDNAYDLKHLIERNFSVSVSIPVGTTSFIKISSTNKDKKIISENINNSINFILKRHTEMARNLTIHL